MIYEEILPVRKFIMTDVLKQSSVPKFTTGYVYHVSKHVGGQKPYLQVLAVLTRSGKTGKPRIQQKELFVAPLVLKNLFKNNNVYEGIGYILTKLDKKSVLDMSSFEFLSWSFAQILYLDRIRVKELWPNVFDAVTNSLRDLAKNFDNTPIEVMTAITDNMEVRKHFLHRLRSANSFAKDQIKHDQNSPLLNLIESHIVNANLEENKELKEKLEYYYVTLLNEGKLNEDLFTERENVLHEYESSGYWD